MTKFRFLLFAALLCGMDAWAQPLAYPATRKVDSIDLYFGTKVPDPYRWLEDDNSKETAAWVQSENKVTNEYLSRIPYRNDIKNRLTQIWNFEKMTTPYKKGKYYFYSKNDGIQNQNVLYVMEGLTGTPRVLIDPNVLSTDGTTSLNGTAVSHDGKYMAYGLSKAGSDWTDYDVIDISTGQKTSDHLKWIKFSGIAWQGNGFYYGRYDEPKNGHDFSAQNKYQKLYYHKIGDTQDKDQLIYQDSLHPDYSFGPQTSDDENWLIVYTTESTTGTQIMIKDLKNGGDFKKVITNFDNDYGVLDVIDNKLIVRTNYMAPMYRLVSMPVASAADPTTWTDILPEKKKERQLLDGVMLAGGKLVVNYLVDVKTKMFVYDMKGKMENEITFPGIAMCGEMNGDKNDNTIFYTLSTFTAPPSIYKYDLKTKTGELYNRPKIDFKSEDYETKQVFYSSKDGTKVPMFITYKKGTKFDGTAPCFLFGYGGFNLFYGPEFRIDRAVFLEKGGIYAVANMRGGGEYGEEWHQAGTKCKKQNVFDDFIAAAEYLCNNKYTNKDKLAIQGRSNGGLLIGAVITERPDLCKVAIPMVGVLDMLRYDKFTIGRAWCTDYGLSENKDEFECLYKYSPLHNVKDVSYPATMITTGDHDDRVVPAHSFKFAATMQEHQKGNNPVVIRIDSSAGHGAGKPTAKQIEEQADIWSFIFQNLGMKY